MSINLLVLSLPLPPGVLPFLGFLVLIILIILLDFLLGLVPVSWVPLACFILSFCGSASSSSLKGNSTWEIKFSDPDSL